MVVQRLLSAHIATWNEDEVLFSDARHCHALVIASLNEVFRSDLVAAGCSVQPFLCFALIKSDTSSTTSRTPLISCANLPKNMPSTHWPSPFPPLVFPLHRPGPALPPYTTLVSPVRWGKEDTTCRIACTTGPTKSTSAGSLAPIAHTGSYAKMTGAPAGTASSTEVICGVSWRIALPTAMLSGPSEEGGGSVSPTQTSGIIRQRQTAAAFFAVVSFV